MKSDSDVEENPHRLDAATIDLGRANINRIRAQLRKRGSAHLPSVQPATDASPSLIDPGVVESAELSVDQIAAQMAAGAERDRLERRVAQLEGEVARLRAALAGVLDAATGGLRDSSTVDHRS